MLGGIGNLAGMMKQAMEMKGKLQEMQESMINLRFEADSGAGAVTATVNGKLELVALKINPETLKSGDVEMLEDLVRSAVCAAQRKATDGVKAEMAKMTGGMNIPGLDSLLGAK
jgi:nucleoid-associated protein EbfC